MSSPRLILWTQKHTIRWYGPGGQSTSYYFESSYGHSDTRDRIEAGEVAARFEPPRTVSGSRMAPRKSGAIEIKPIMMGDDWDEEIEDDIPTIGTIEGGTGLIYAGTDHYFVGPAGGGKTYLLQHFSNEHTLTDDTALVIYLDYESNRKRFKARLKQMGVTREQAERIGYLRPQGSIMKQHAYGAAWLSWAQENAPSLVLIDSVAVAMNAAGLDENDNNHATAWWYGAIEPLNALGITSARIDHNGKEQMGKKNLDARGASAKLQRVDGAAYALVVEKPWNKTTSGSAKLICLKDRSGEHIAGTVVARMTVALTGDCQMTITLAVVIAPPRNIDGTIRLTGLMEKISRLVELGGQMNVTAIRAAAAAKATAVTETLDLLEREGFLSVEAGPRGAKLYTAKVAYRQSEDSFSDRYAGHVPRESSGHPEFDTTSVF